MTKLSQGKSRFFNFIVSSPDFQKGNLRNPNEKSAGAKESGDYLKRLKGFAQQMRLNPTPTENKFFNFLKENNIPFKNQVVILPYIIDFLLEGKNLVVELDGQHHNQNLNQMTYDTKRDELLMSMRLTVIRFNNENLDLNQIKEIYKKQPDFNNIKLLNRIGYHNHYYEKRAFGGKALGYFNKYFARYFVKEINKIVRMYKIDFQKSFA